jgi:hypothetical protein
MPPADKAAKAKAAAAAKKIEDKTFGMKNKNKSKQVQQQIAQMKQAAGASHRDSVRSRTTEIWIARDAMRVPACLPA